MSTQGLTGTIFLAAMLAIISGCASVLSAPQNPDAPPSQAYPPIPPPPKSPPKPDAAPPAAPPAANLPADASPKTDEKKGFELSDLAPENVWKNVKNVTGFGPDEKLARTNLQEGEALLREAKQLTATDTKASQAKYTEAIPKFTTAISRWPDSLLEEDAQFYVAECYFFTDQYPKAHDAYGDLIKKHDNSRYLDTVMQREFAIGRYWEHQYFKDPHWPVTPNALDKERPWFDTFGNAIHAYEQVRLHDPTGPLADSAVMATANAYFVKGEFENAAYNYDQLRKEYPTSKFQPQAHVLGLQSKLRVYQGKDYDGVPLKDAQEIARQALTQFGTQLNPAERDRISQTSKEIVEMFAERDWAVAQYYEAKSYYGAARLYYQDLIQEYPLTEFAQKAKTRLHEIRDKPDMPKNHLKWLTDMFPSELQ
jgi:outer membrane protein assembly factor BamD (BamD/ComL family)